jgi:TetR/AcrR family transcriptional regulator, transcriptional repressor for nem operon
MPPSQEEHPTRQRILETARRLFHEQGFHATGISTILREADVNSGSLYHYFPSKEAVLAGVLERYLHLLRPMVMDPVEGVSDDPIGRVFALLSYYRQGLQMTGFRMGCPIGNLALEVGDDNDVARAFIDQNFRNWAEVVRGWLDAAGDRLPRTTDRARLAGLVLTIMEGAMMRARAARSFEPFDDSVAELRAYFDQLEHTARAASGPGDLHVAP